MFFPVVSFLFPNLVVPSRVSRRQARRRTSLASPTFELAQSVSAYSDRVVPLPVASSGAEWPGRAHPHCFVPGRSVAPPFWLSPVSKGGCQISRQGLHSFPLSPSSQGPAVGQSEGAIGCLGQSQMSQRGLASGPPSSCRRRYEPPDERLPNLSSSLFNSLFMCAALQGAYRPFSVFILSQLFLIRFLIHIPSPPAWQNGASGPWALEAWP